MQYSGQKGRKRLEWQEALPQKHYVITLRVHVGLSYLLCIPLTLKEKPEKMVWQRETQVVARPSTLMEHVMPTDYYYNIIESEDHR